MLDDYQPVCGGNLAEKRERAVASCFWQPGAPAKSKRPGRQNCNSFPRLEEGTVANILPETSTLKVFSSVGAS